jgi:hypothetical protein
VAKAIGLGVSQQMVQDQALSSWYPLGDSNKLKGWDEEDYKSGAGVFMRHLLHANQRLGSPITPLVESAPFQTFLLNAATAATTAQQDDLFDAFNVLATLTTAIKLIRSS